MLEEDIIDTLLRYGLFIGAIFQLACIGAVVMMPDSHTNANNGIELFHDSEDGGSEDDHRSEDQGSPSHQGQGHASSPTHNKPHKQGGKRDNKKKRR